MEIRDSNEEEEEEEEAEVKREEEEMMAENLNASGTLLFSCKPRPAWPPRQFSSSINFRISCLGRVRRRGSGEEEE
ncbi:hypothetical protein Pcinc_040771 [Petrolisthes cinctipes]|uniref:Uncharacterized protein n=1 Tax=Petrolisthes cinctipes TaxID=88211 RepID=A0AAE1BKT9_PETCI|nr:hypothetical protein Pcinc_040771 [Petrolisthes cinctipes]